MPGSSRIHLCGVFPVKRAPGIAINVFRKLGRPLTQAVNEVIAARKNVLKYEYGNGSLRGSFVLVSYTTMSVNIISF